jgi:hypothetical protein
VTEKQLLAVSACVSKNYPVLAINLGLTDPEIGRIEIDTSKYNCQYTIFKILRRWKTNNEEKATRSRLIKACEETGDIDIDKVQKVIKITSCCPLKKDYNTWTIGMCSVYI